MTTDDEMPVEHLSMRHIAVGVAVVGLRGASTVSGVGRSLAATAGRPVTASWSSSLLSRPRVALAARGARLAALGRRSESQLREQAGTRAGAAVERVTADLLSHPVIDRVVAQVIESPVIDHVVAQVIESPVIDHVVAQVIESTVIDHVVAQVIESTVIDRVVAQVIESPEFDRAVVAGLDNPALEELVAGVVQSEGLERALLRVLDSELVDELSERLLASDQVHRWIQDIAQRREVRAALAQQSTGLVNEVADEMRVRTVRADAAVERLARSILHRRPAPWARDSG